MPPSRELAQRPGRPGAGEQVLVGRARERALLAEQLDRLTAGHGGLVLLGGAAGAGKTSLVHVVERQADLVDAVVATGHCYDVTTTPLYGPWRELFARLAVQVSNEMGALVPDLDQASGTSADAHHAQLREALVELARSRPLVLVLEDLHWSDAPSLDLLRVVARTLDETPILLLVTYRADELALDHALAIMLPLLVREAGAARIELHPLDIAAVRELLRAEFMLADADEIRLADYLMQRSGGNPLFLGELLRDAIEEGRLVQQEPCWTLGDLGDLGVPRLLRQIISGRVARLQPFTQQQLSIAAVINNAIAIDLWAEVGGVAEDGLLDAVEEAIDARLLASSDDGRTLQFAHGLIGDALYGSTLPPRRRIWHRAVGDALVARSRPDPELVAHHFQRAGDPRAALWLVRAAEQAMRLNALKQMIERAESALAALDHDRTPSLERGWLLYNAGFMMLPSGPGFLDRYRSIIDEVGAIGREIDDPFLVGYSLLDSGGLSYSARDLRRAIAQITAAVAIFDAIPDDRLPPVELAPGRVLAAWPGTTDAATRRDGVAWRDQPWGGFVTRINLSILLSEAGRIPEALEQARRYATGIDDAELPPEIGDDLAPAHGVLFECAIMLGDVPGARRAIAQSFDIIARLDNPWLLAQVLAMKLDRLLNLYVTEQVAERRQLEDEILAHCARLQPGAPQAPNGQQAILGQLILTGRWDEAYRISSTTIVNLVGLLLVPLATVQLAHGILARRRGDLEASWTQVRELLPAGPDTALGDVPYQFSVDAQLLAGQLALDAGDLDLVRSWLEAHSLWLGESGVVLGQAECHLLWARYHWLAGDVTAAEDRAQQALDRARDPRQPPALIAAQRYLGELATAAGRYDDAASHLAASATLAGACEAPFEQALAGIALADLALARGDLEPARTQLADARQLVEPLRALPSLAQIVALEAQCDAASRATRRPVAPAGISPRELDVLRLVASGLSTAEIAERLFLSPRTVTTHLSSLYGKLGVNTRAAVVRFAIDNGLV